MEETVNEIMEFIKQKTENFSYMDQAQIFEEVSGKVLDMNADALKAEYLGTDEYLLDGV